MSLYETSSEEALATLRQDMPRTFPSHALFLSDTYSPHAQPAESHVRPGMLRRSLYHILASYAAFDRDVGYCQGTHSRRGRDGGDVEEVAGRVGEWGRKAKGFLATTKAIKRNGRGLRWAGKHEKTESRGVDSVPCQQTPRKRSLTKSLFLETAGMSYVAATLLMFADEEVGTTLRACA